MGARARLAQLWRMDSATLSRIVSRLPNISFLGCFYAEDEVPPFPVIPSNGNFEKIRIALLLSDKHWRLKGYTFGQPFVFDSGPIPGNTSTCGAFCLFWCISLASGAGRPSLIERRNLLSLISVGADELPTEMAFMVICFLRNWWLEIVAGDGRCCCL